MFGNISIFDHFCFLWGKPSFGRLMSHSPAGHQDQPWFSSVENPQKSLKSPMASSHFRHDMPWPLMTSILWDVGFVWICFILKASADLSCLLWKVQLEDAEAILKPDLESRIFKAHAAATSAEQPHSAIKLLPHGCHSVWPGELTALGTGNWDPQSQWWGAVHLVVEGLDSRGPEGGCTFCDGHPSVLLWVCPHGQWRRYHHLENRLPLGYGLRFGRPGPRRGNLKIDHQDLAALSTSRRCTWKAYDWGRGIPLNGDLKIFKFLPRVG